MKVQPTQAFCYPTSTGTVALGGCGGELVLVPFKGARHRGPALVCPRCDLLDKWPKPKGTR